MATINLLFVMTAGRVFIGKPASIRQRSGIQRGGAVFLLRRFVLLFFTPVLAVYDTIQHSRHIYCFYKQDIEEQLAIHTVSADVPEN